MNQAPNQPVETNRRPNSALDAWRQFGRAAHAQPFLSAAVAHLFRWATMRTLAIFRVVLLASVMVGCRSPRPSQVLFRRPLTEVVAAIQQSCASIEAAAKQPGGKWIAGTNALPGVSYTVHIQDQFTSYPIGRTEISAVSTSPTETQLRVISLEPTSMRWRRRPEVESQTIAEIAQILGK